MRRAYDIWRLQFVCIPRKCKWLVWYSSVYHKRALHNENILAIHDKIRSSLFTPSFFWTDPNEELLARHACRRVTFQITVTMTLTVVHQLEKTSFWETFRSESVHSNNMALTDYVPGNVRFLELWLSFSNLVILIEEIRGPWSIRFYCNLYLCFNSLIPNAEQKKENNLSNIIALVLSAWSRWTCRWTMTTQCHSVRLSSLSFELHWTSSYAETWMQMILN